MSRSRSDKTTIEAASIVWKPLCGPLSRGVFVLVCCDLDGCITEAKGLRFDLAALADLARGVAAFPGVFTICTGRPAPYVEAIVQVLDLVDAPTPCICEGGGVLYTPSEDRCEAVAGQVDADAVRALLPAGAYREATGKLASYTAFPEPGYTVDALYALVVAGQLTGVEVSRSVAAVDVTPAGVDKMYGVRTLLDRADSDWEDVLAIGDSWNDLPMLRAARLFACPANAVPEVRAVADYVSPLPATRGVADILRWAAAQPTRADGARG
jgi:hydroxymethylpyrimidine pyrophosphatase-like HAD family hydrolase